MDSLLIGIIIIGLLHGLEPGHGWPIAILYSFRQKKPYFHGFMSSLILGICHFISSIFAALIFVIAAKFFDMSAIWFKIIAIILLLILAYRFWVEKADDTLVTETQHEHIHGNEEPLVHSHEHIHLDGITHEHSHKHPKSVPITLKGLAIYGLILGFAHEEEFALLALAIGGVNPYLLMVIYGGCVIFSLVGITLIGLKIYEILTPWMKKWMKYIPKISAITLIVLAVALIIEFFI
jgi:nickel/cobalt transporter (NicO) family protein